MNLLINDINNIEDKVLSAIVRDYGATLFNMKSVVQLQLDIPLSQAELRLALLGLCKKAYVIRMRKISGEFVYCVPYERYIQTMMGLTRDFLDEITPVDMTINPVSVNDGPTDHDVVMELIIFIGWINRTQPQFNKHGQLDKKLVNNLLRHIHLNSERLSAYVGKYAGNFAMPLPVSILLDLGLRLGMIIISEEGQIRIDTERTVQWLERHPNDIHLELFHNWFRVHYPDGHDQRHFLVVLLMLQKDQWYSTRQVTQQMKWQADNDPTIYSFLEALEQFGWIQLARTEEGTHIFSSKIGVNNKLKYNSIEGWYVQPDFDIIVPQQMSYLNHYLLNLYTILKFRDQMYTYEINRESVYSAFQQHWTVDRIIEHLERYAQYGVPENVNVSLLHWDKLYQAVQLEAVTLLRCKSTLIAEELLTISEIANIINEQTRIRPELFIIANEHVDFIRKKLSTIGYQTDKLLVDHNHLTHSSDVEQPEPLFVIFHSPLRYDMYKLDDEQYEIHSLYPGINKVPSGWLNKYAPYHISTMKQILHQAIEWQSYIQINYEGDDLIIAPHVINESASSVSVEGRLGLKTLSLPIDRIKAIQIILPGIHNATKYMSTIV